MSRTPQYKVLLLRVILKVPIAHSTYVVSDVHRAINRNWCYPCMHSKQGVAFVILTEESATELLTRIRPRLEAVTSVENYWCHIALEDMAARDGNLDPLRTYVLEAWEELRKRNKPDYFRQPERAEALVIGNMENLDRSTAVQMGIKGRRPGKSL
jgi:hypothetical protein